MTDGKMSGDNTVMAWSIRETDEATCVTRLMRQEKVEEINTLWLFVSDD